MNISGNKPPEGQGPGRITPGPAGPQASQKPQTAAAQDKPVPSQSTAPKDTVEISGRGREAAELTAAVNRLPDVREAKVQEIKQAVDAGSYQVDARKVAESILKEI